MQRLLLCSLVVARAAPAEEQLHGASPLEEVAEAPAWCTKRRYLLTHHRAGGIVSHAAVAALNLALVNHCPPGQVRLVTLAGHGINFNFTSSVADSCSHIHSRAGETHSSVQHWMNAHVQLGMVSSQPPPPDDALVLHLARNPLEMVVSSYAYDLEGKEPSWQSAPVTPFHHCRRQFHEHFGEQQSLLTQCTSGIGPYCTGIDAVVAAAQPDGTGELAPRLPVPDPIEAAMAGAPRESWSRYLARVGEDEGLLAEAVMMKTLALRNMAQIRQLSAESPRRQTVCLAFLEEGTVDHCRQKWEQLVADLEFPSHLIPNISAAIAAATCSRARDGQSADVEEEPGASIIMRNRTQAADRVVRLARIDEEVLNGSLAQIHSYVGCPLGHRYASWRMPRGVGLDTHRRRLLRGAQQLHAVDERTLFPRFQEIV